MQHVLIAEQHSTSLFSITSLQIDYYLVPIECLQPSH